MEIKRISESEYLSKTMEEPVESKRSYGCIKTEYGTQYFSWSSSTSYPQLDILENYFVLRVDYDFKIFSKEEKYLKNINMVSLAYEVSNIIKGYIIFTGELGIKVLDEETLEILCDMDGLPDVYESYKIEGKQVTVKTLGGSEYKGVIKRDH